MDEAFFASFGCALTLFILGVVLVVPFRIIALQVIEHMSKALGVAVFALGFQLLLAVLPIFGGSLVAEQLFDLLDEEGVLVGYFASLTLVFLLANVAQDRKPFRAGLRWWLAKSDSHTSARDPH